MPSLHNTGSRVLGCMDGGSVKHYYHQNVSSHDATDEKSIIKEKGVHHSCQGHSNIVWTSAVKNACSGVLTETMFRNCKSAVGHIDLISSFGIAVVAVA